EPRDSPRFHRDDAARARTDLDSGHEQVRVSGFGGSRRAGIDFREPAKPWEETDTFGADVTGPGGDAGVGTDQAAAFVSAGGRRDCSGGQAEQFHARRGGRLAWSPRRM